MTVVTTSDGAEQIASKGFLFYGEGIDAIADLTKTPRARLDIVRHIGGANILGTGSHYEYVKSRSDRARTWPDDIVVVVNAGEEAIGKAVIRIPDDEYTVISTREVSPLPQSLHYYEVRVEGESGHAERSTRPSGGSKVVVRPVADSTETTESFTTRLERWFRASVAQIAPLEQQRLQTELDRDPGRDIGWLVAQVLVGELGDADAAIDTEIGPWNSSAQVRSLLRVDEDALRALVDSRALLGIRFADGDLYFPARQFADARPLPGLQPVLDALDAASGDREAWALWLAGEYRSTDGRITLDSKWEALQNPAHLDDLLLQAGRDSRSWTS